MPQAARTFQTRREKFESTLTNAEALAACRPVNDQFIASLIKQHDDALKGRRNPLSDNQWAYVHQKALTLAAPMPVADLGSIKGIVDLFDKVRQHVQRPKIRLSLLGTPLALQLAGSQSKHPGTINVTDGGRFGNNVWYGRIDLEGKMETSRNCTEKVLKILRLFAKFPAELAALHGRLNGKCCFCGIRLTDERSTEVGYGEICADHYGLPWGDVHFDFSPLADPELQELIKSLENKDSDALAKPAVADEITTLLEQTKHPEHDAPVKLFPFQEKALAQIMEKAPVKVVVPADTGKTRQLTSAELDQLSPEDRKGIAKAVLKSRTAPVTPVTGGMVQFDVRVPDEREFDAMIAEADREDSRLAAEAKMHRDEVAERIREYERSLGRDVVGA